MDLLTKFSAHWKKEFSHLLAPASRLLVTVSGGLDSTVLLDLLQQTGSAMVIAHCNFQLRGEESERDEKFVIELAQKYGVDILVKRFDTEHFASERNISIQEAARELRYAWFGAVIDGWYKENGIANYILTAHHADDNIETVMMHFFRGSGLHGLTGISPVQKDRRLLRPLLPFRKHELEAYGAGKGLKFVEDSSNVSDKYTRNFFRHRIIPDIKEIFPQVEENLLLNTRRLSEAEMIYKQAIDRHLKKLLVKKDGEIHVPVLLWKKTAPLHTITWEIIKNFGFSAAQTGEVIKLLDAGNGAFIASATHRIIRNRQWMIIAEIATEQPAHILIEEDTQTVRFGNGSLTIKRIAGPDDKPSAAPTEAWIDASKLRFPLLLRKWKQGDYFYPLGMQKKKKLSRFMIDNKLARTDKEKVWVVESDKKIVWVVGLRIDDRVKVSPTTHKILILSL